MWGVAKDELVLRVKGGGTLPDHLHIAEPGLESSLHVLVTPLLNGSPLPPACTMTNSRCTLILVDAFVL